MPEPSAVVSTENKKKWGAGEWLGVAGIVLGAVISLFFWWLSEKTRDLSFAISPLRPEIVRAGIASDVRAFYKDIPITGNLSVIQIAVWNQGREPIRYQEDVLRAIAITPIGSMKIIEAKIVSATRDEIAFRLSPAQQDGRIELSWRILEKGDGALLQLLAVDAPVVPIELSGTIVGQGSLGADTFRAAASQVVAGKRVQRSWSDYVLPGLVTVSFIVFLALLIRDARTKGYWKTARKNAFLIVLQVCVFFLMAWAFWRSTPSSPFGF